MFAGSEFKNSEGLFRNYEGIMQKFFRLSLTPNDQVTRGIALVVFAGGNDSIDAEQPFTGRQGRNIVVVTGHEDDAAVDIAAAQVCAGLY